jgi:hypothetical protein
LAFPFLIRHFKSECRFGNAFDLARKIPALIVEEGLAVAKEELQIVNL